MTYSDNGAERLKLLQQHRQENNQFWKEDKLERQALFDRHQQEVKEQLISEPNSMIRAKTLRRHSSEHMEFNAFRKDKKWRLYNQHQWELDDLTKRQNIGKATAPDEKEPD